MAARSPAPRRVHLGGSAFTWSTEQILALSDADLAAYGLRDVRACTPPVLPAATAHGASVAAPVAGVGTLPASRAPGHDETAKGLRLTDVRCVLQGRTVLSIDEAFFPASQVTAVCGPNGAGKTTLARAVAGLQRHFSSMELDEVRVERRERLRHTMIVMQDVQRQLFTDSVRAEIRLSASRSGAGGGKLSDAEVDQVLSEFDLLSCAEQHPLALSGGQQQRLVIATTRCSHVRVVIYDEPSSGVDRRHLESIARAVRDSARAGAVVLLITHDEDPLRAAAQTRLDLRPPSE
ncbi:ATP-binding cassette domain-containing protein [uncultured Actinomyces sp.]|uniref:ATP-binding cassette domain-containing protein n=1 Tax=uncultured Actinomyces sp. TaxID=249061 RepID=UPI00262C57C8|nr:ATP-binding cassette domain-containing protein [uncultured Actinomyces sp.]